MFVGLNTSSFKYAQAWASTSVALQFLNDFQTCVEKIEFDYKELCMKKVVIFSLLPVLMAGLASARDAEHHHAGDRAGAGA